MKTPDDDFIIDEDQSLGTGGFGTVFVAHLPRSDKVLAVKVFTSKGSSLEAAHFDIVSEVRMSMLVSGSNGEAFVKCYGGCVGRPSYGRKSVTVTGYLLMEKMDGTLTDFLTTLHQRYPAGVPSRHRGAIGLALVYVLEELARLRVCHNDIRRPNLLVVGDVDCETKPFKLKLGDFGLAARYGDVPSIPVTSDPVTSDTVQRRTHLTGLKTSSKAAGKLREHDSRYPTYHPMRGCVNAGSSVDTFSVMVVLLAVVYGTSRSPGGQRCVYDQFKKDGRVPPCPPTHLERAPYAQFREMATRVLDVNKLGGETVVNFVYMRHVLNGIYDLGLSVVQPYSPI
jgi:serine/threonine protein kinase